MKRRKLLTESQLCHDWHEIADSDPRRWRPCTLAKDHSGDHKDHTGKGWQRDRDAAPADTH